MSERHPGRIYLFTEFSNRLEQQVINAEAHYRHFPSQYANHFFPERSNNIALQPRVSSLFKLGLMFSSSPLHGVRMMKGQQQVFLK